MKKKKKEEVSEYRISWFKLLMNKFERWHIKKIINHPEGRFPGVERKKEEKK
jgi:hypothetical protein